MGGQKISTNNITRLIGAGVVLVLIGLVVVLGLKYRELSRTIAEKDKTIEELLAKEREATVMRKVSQQLEEIAYQQKEKADSDKKEAERQSDIARTMRKKAEEESQKAERERGIALEAMQLAKEEERKAEDERQKAIEMKDVAVKAQEKTSTLSYQILGRMVGMRSRNQYKVGNKDLAKKLAYASWHFTNKYGGDIYDSEVIGALINSGDGIVPYKEQFGTVSAVKSIKSANKNVTYIFACTKYGVIFRTDLDAKHCMAKLGQETLFQDKTYDFRGMAVDDNRTIYAASLNGMVIKLDTLGKTNRANTTVGELKDIFLTKGKILVVGKKGLELLDKETLARIDKKEMQIFASNRGGMPIVFDENGGAYKVGDDLKTEKIDILFTTPATAYTDNGTYKAIGDTKGAIKIVDKAGKEKNLLGHKSAITSLIFQNDKLFSTSMDGTIRVWNVESLTTNPVILNDFKDWICEAHWGSGLFLGMGGGSVVYMNITPDKLAEHLHHTIDKDLTQEEWKEFVGKDIKYEKLITEK